MIREKINNIQRLLGQQKIDTLLIGNFGHQVRDDLLYYLLLTHLELGIMFIPSSGRPILYAIPFEVDQLTKAYPEMIVESLDKKLEVNLKKYKGNIGYRPSSLPSKQYKKKYIAFTGEEKLISIKLNEEQKFLQKAAEITDDIFTNLVKNWGEFKTETDAATFILKQCLEHDVESSFPPIIASGTNAANPHHHPKDTKLKKGFCVIDMGVRYKGYCSDMTRTVYIGNPSDKSKADYNHILKTQEQAISEVQVGTKISDIAKNCRKNLGNDFNKYFAHSLGHGLGSQVHELPRISTKENLLLEEGMYITIEPGVYIPGKWGIRIEDDVLVTKKGPKVLTQASKKLTTI
jgi:Xaa-Pro aminopeptidase